MSFMGYTLYLLLSHSILYGMCRSTSVSAVFVYVLSAGHDCIGKKYVGKYISRRECT